jgi:AAA domain
MADNRVRNRNRKIEFLCDRTLQERIPLRLPTIVAGPPDTNKSSWAVKIAAHASRNGVPVLYWTSEDTPLDAVCVPRLEAAGANMKNVTTLGDEVKIPSGVPQIEKTIRGKGIGLVCADTWDSFLDTGVYTRRLNPNMAQFRRVLEDNDCAFIGVHHTVRIRKGMTPLDAFGGSGQGPSGVVRMGYLMGKDPEDPDRRILANAKWSYGPKLESLVYEVDVDDVEVYDRDGKKHFDAIVYLAGPILGEEGLTAEELVSTWTPAKQITTPGAIGRPNVKGSAAAEALVTFFRNEPEHRARKDRVLDAMTASGHTRRTLYRAMKDLGGSLGKGRNPWWSLPKDLIERQEQFEDEDPDEGGQ